MHLSTCFLLVNSHLGHFNREPRTVNRSTQVYLDSENRYRDLIGEGLKRYHYLFLGEKCIIILTVSVERIGPLTFFLALGRQLETNYAYPEENTVLG